MRVCVCVCVCCQCSYVDALLSSILILSDVIRSCTCDGAIAAKSECMMLQRGMYYCVTINFCAGFVGSVCETNVFVRGRMYRSLSSKQRLVEEG